MDTAAKKSLGQHWLNDPASLGAIISAARLSKADTVLEIGPGRGSLTALLTGSAARVVAVEFDSLLASQLKAAVPAGNLTVYCSDILTFDLSELPPGYKVVANIPYYLTSHLLRQLCESVNPPSRMVLLVQKEVAERVAAKPGHMSLLSISVQYYCDVSLGAPVKAELFIPPPKIDSQILIMDYRGPAFADTDSREFFRIIKAGFAGRRKKLRSSLSAGLRITKPEADELLVRAGIDPDLRAQSLGLEDWRKLYLAVLK